MEARWGKEGEVGSVELGKEWGKELGWGQGGESRGRRGKVGEGSRIEGAQGRRQGREGGRGGIGWGRQ